MFNAEELNLPGITSKREISAVLRPMRLEMQNVPLDPAPVFDSLVTGSACRSSNCSSCNRRPDFCDSFRPPPPAGLQVMPIFRHADRGAPRGTSCTAGGKTRACPPTFAKQLFLTLMIMLNGGMYRRSGCKKCIIVSAKYSQQGRRHQGKPNFAHTSKSRNRFAKHSTPSIRAS
jgi:hypothetical protein